MQVIRVKSNIYEVVIHFESNPNQLENWMNALLMLIYNLKLPNFEILFFKLPNDFTFINY